MVWGSIDFFCLFFLYLGGVSIQEELLEILLMKERTRGEVISHMFTNFATGSITPLQKPMCFFYGWDTCSTLL